MSIQEWLDLLNGRVFFWLHPDRLTRLLSARNYKNSEHDVITLDTQSLISAYGAKVVLSPINSGATLFPRARPRGSGTFTKLADYPDEKWRIRADATAVAELAVIGGVPDIATFVVSVDRYQGPVRKSTLFKP
ncbi:MAG: hypothetical protein Q7V58_11725 [Actinomycetota bacterium]|nr:hypothetical protein [Actinomycetota bacterium]